MTETQQNDLDDVIDAADDDRDDAEDDTDDRTVADEESQAPPYRPRPLAAVSTPDEARRRQQEIHDRAHALVHRRAEEAGVEFMEFVGWLVEARRTAHTHAITILGRDDWREELDRERAEARATWDAELARSFAAAVKDVLPTAADLTSERRRALIVPALRTWAAEHDPGRGALLLGLSGIGKSVACVEFCHRVQQQDAAASWARQVERRVEIMMPMGCRVHLTSAAAIGACTQYGQVDWVRGALFAVRDVPILVIDDLGWEPAAGLPAIRELLAHRYGEGLPTIVTSGETLPALRERYGDAVLRRIVECRGVTTPPLDLHPKARGK